MIKVAVSSFFNPLHVGHLRYLKDAKKKGDILIAIVNTDHQVKLKGSTPFMKQKERLGIVEAIKYVDKVILCVDKDGSVCKTLAKIKPDIFCVGADHYKSENLKEAKVCAKLGIKICYGVGGRKKIQSSSKLINKVKKYA